MPSEDPQQITQDYQRRIEEAERQRVQDAAAAQAEEAPSNENEDPVERKKRKRKEEMAIMKIKQSKEFKRRKHENNDDEDDDVLARNMLKKAQPLPGQLENCETCEKRFTVTPYSKTGVGGGLLCIKCSKEVRDGEKKAEAMEKKKKAPPKLRKRQTESDRMMGDVKPGARSLVEQCVNRVADVVYDIDEFGDLPQNLLNRLSQILSKKRVITPRTLKLLLQPGIDRIAIYDCGKLETEDFHKIFAFMPDLEIVNLRFAGQMKDDSLRYMIEKNHHIKHLQLGATNLISDKAWVELFRQRGPQLESLKLSELNDSLNDESISELTKHCSNLKRLKIRSCSHITTASLPFFAELTQLEHLTLSVAQHTPDALLDQLDKSPSAILVDLIRELGPNLQTLSLEDYVEAEDEVIDAIRDNCTNLKKLRFTGNNNCSDRAFASLFGSESSNPPIPYIDLSANHSVDNANPDGPEDDPIGFGSEGFRAMMRHSGRLLERLDLHSCRHISHEALLEVFDGRKQYGMLKDIDLSFCTYVDDTVMAGIFRSCPKLVKLAVFACFSARGASIPPGIAVIGLPNAKDNIIINGDAMIDAQTTI